MANSFVKCVFLSIIRLSVFLVVGIGVLFISVSSSHAASTDKFDYQINHSDLTNGQMIGIEPKNPQILRGSDSIDTVYANDKNRPQMDVIDISSHNGSISVAQFKKMRTAYGIKGVVVKLTEGDVYRNPFAKEQCDNAKAAGLVVSAYHYAWHDGFNGTTKESINEANYFVKYALELKLPTTTVMVDDVESNIKPKNKKQLSVKDTTNAFITQVKKLGFANTSIYASLSWFTPNVIEASMCETTHCWVAQYPYHPNASMKYNSKLSLWQWSSRLHFPDKDMPQGSFDISQSYNDYFTKVQVAESDDDAYDSEDDQNTDVNPNADNLVKFDSPVPLKPHLPKVSFTKSAINKPKVGSKRVTIKWKTPKVTVDKIRSLVPLDYISGFQITYKQKGTKKWKTIKVSKKSLTKVIKGLKKGKKYYFKIRCFYKYKDESQVTKIQYAPYSKTVLSATVKK